MTLRALVDRERRRVRRFELVGGAALVAGCAIGIVTIATLVLGHARWLQLPRILPLLAWVAVLAAVAWMVRASRRRFRNFAERSAVAEAIEREQSMRAGALRGAIEVGEDSAFGRHAAALAAQALAPHADALAPRFRTQARQYALRGVAVAVVTVVLLAVIAPLNGDGLLAVLRPVSAWRGTLLPSLHFAGLRDTARRGDSVRVVIEAHGRATVHLASRVTGEGWRVRDLAVDTKTGMAVSTVGPLRGDLTLRASDGRSATDSALVRVVDRPFVGAVTLRAVYPAYLGRAPETLPAGELAVVPRGTSLQLAGRASVPLAAAGLTHDRDTTAFHVSGQGFAGAWHPATGGTWTWYARSVMSPIQDVPSPLEIAVVPDSAPRAEIITPATDTVVAAVDTVSVQVAVTDDHGIASVALLGRHADSVGAAVSVQPLAAAAGAEWTGTVRVDLSALKLAPGGVFGVRVSAVDNSPWAQRTTSRELLFRVPTIDERRQLARAAGDSAVQAIRRTATEAQSLEQRTAELSQRRENQDAVRGPQSGDQNSMSFEAAQRAKALGQEQRDLAAQVSKLQESARQLEEQLGKAGAMDSALATQLRNAQQMLQDALTPQLMAEMQKLDQAANAQDAKATDQALANLADMQKQLRAQLEKSAQMLQRAAFEGAMKTLHDEATDVATKERALADSAPSDTATRGQGQRALADRSAALADAIHALQDKLADANANAGAKNAETAHTYASASTQSMQQRGDAKTAATEMQRAADAMQQARDQQVAAWQGELQAVLDRAIPELLEMAHQENLMARGVLAGDVSAVTLRSPQGAIQQGVQQVQQALLEQAQRSALVSGGAQRAMVDATQQVAAATRALSDSGMAEGGADALGEAFHALNSAAVALARDRERMNGAKSASGFAELLQQLQQAAKQQGDINAQAQGLLPLSGQNAPTAVAQARARALGGQERQLAQKLDNMSDATGGDRAAQLAREARAVAQSLEQGRVDAATVQRQQQLLQHMLDAGRSLQNDQRDDSGKRVAEAALHPRLFTPQSGPASGASATKYPAPSWQDLRGRSAQERQAILEYFRRINGATRP